MSGIGLARPIQEDIRSVRFLFGDITARIDNRAPYAIKGNANGTDTLWSVYPVPIKDELTIQWPESIRGEIAIHILNAQGTNIYTRGGIADTSRKYNLRMADVRMSQGIYFVVLQQSNGRHFVRKISKE